MTQAQRLIVAKVALERIKLIGYASEPGTVKFSVLRMIEVAEEALCQFRARPAASSPPPTPTGRTAEELYPAGRPVLHQLNKEKKGDRE